MKRDSLEKLNVLTEASFIDLVSNEIVLVLLGLGVGEGLGVRISQSGSD